MGCRGGPQVAYLPGCTVSEFAALALYPIWAVAMLVAATALRLGRASGRGILVVCLCLAFWATGLLLFKTPETELLAERVLPVGTLLAGAFVHAGVDITRSSRRGVVWATYACSVAIMIVGASAPRLLYGPGLRGTGPLFWVIAAPSALGTVAVVLWLGRAAIAVQGPERRRRFALAITMAVASLGGGVAVGVRVFGWGDVEFAAPLLVVAILLTAYVVLGAERGRARELVAQGLTFAVITAALSTVGLVAFFHVLPVMTPGKGESFAWLAFVVFFTALPLDSMRMIVVEAVGRVLFKDPIGVRDLAEQIDRTEVRADHAERLAEIGTMASAVAHEIRNPLGVIAAQAKVLERAGASPASVTAIRGQVDRAKHFLEDLLRYSKPRPLDVHEVDVLPALELAAQGVRQSLGDDAPAAGVTIECPKALVLEVDRGAFHDVATVLIHNALIAVDGRDGGAVRVGARAEDGGATIIVEDNGPGVPPEIEATLFSPFVTGRGRDARHPGTGLGLAIAARWVERHGGTLRHERNTGAGARFVARWPGRGARRL